MSSQRASIVAILLLLLVSGVASADPRWWWDDHLVSAFGDAVSIDIDVVEPMSPGQEPAIFVAWASPQATEPGLYLAASFDGGCTFCTNWVYDVTSASPDVALAVAPLLGAGTYSIAIFLTDGPDPLIVYDSVSVPLSGSPEQKCTALVDVVTNAGSILLWNFGSAEQPDITAAYEPPGAPHFHAVWRAWLGPGEREILYARDLAGDGSAWERIGILTQTDPPGTLVMHPKITADMLTGGPPRTSAVNVVLTEPFEKAVYYYRSIDSGEHFDPTGSGGNGRPAVINDTLIGVADGPVALDSGARNFPSDLWHVVAWEESQSGEHNLLIDSQLQIAPSTGSPGWEPLDPIVQTGLVSQEGDPALSVFPGEDGEDVPFYLTWTRNQSGSFEIFYRAGMLNSSNVPPLSLDTFPIPPVRPTDPVVSTSRQLSTCNWQEAGGTCAPNRTQGIAGLAEMDEEGEDVFVVWRDNRIDPNRGDVWFKRTDHGVACPSPPALQTSCPTVDTRRITVSFSPFPTCSSSPLVLERMARYLVYWGTSPGGPYDDRLVVVDDGALGDPVVLELDDLLPATAYFVIVVPEDEARNACPADFDPAVQRVGSPINESTISTLDDCGSVPCDPFSFGGPTVATPGDCEIEVSWTAAMGHQSIEYEVFRDGNLVANRVTGTTWTDPNVTWGQSYVYQVSAADSCANPAPQTGMNEPSAPTQPDDFSGPAVLAPTVLATGGCGVSVDTTVLDPCSGEDTIVDVLRDSVDVATGVTLPWQDWAPGDATYTYQVRGYDIVGNPAVSAGSDIEITGCSGRCLHRKALTGRNTSLAFESPRDPTSDIGFSEPDRSTPYACPFLAGEPDPGAVLAPGNGLVMIFYQVTGAGVDTLRVVKDIPNETLRIQY